MRKTKIVIAGGGFAGLYGRIKKGDAAARERMISANVRLVVSFG